MKTIIQYLILLTLLGSLSAGIIWANRQDKARVCNDVIIEVLNNDSTQFVTKEGVAKKLSMLGIRIEGARFSNIDTEAIENALKTSEYLENVECVILNNDKLLIKASQLVPVMRIFDGNNSYYINQTGKRMRATAEYHIDVPVVEGNFDNKFPPTRLLPLIDFVKNDKALNGLVTMYSVRDSNNIFIVPCIYGHVVNIGNLQNIKSKFEKLKKFYKDVLPVKGWMTYDTISLKFNRQIVATKRVKSQHTEHEYNPEEDEQAPDLSTIVVQDTQTQTVSTTDETTASTHKETPKETPTKKADSDKPSTAQKANNTTASPKQDKKQEKRKEKTSSTPAKSTQKESNTNDKVKSAFSKKADSNNKRTK